MYALHFNSLGRRPFSTGKRRATAKPIAPGPLCLCAPIARVQL